MSPVALVVVVVVVLGLLAGSSVALHRSRSGHARRSRRGGARTPTRRILFPFVARGLSMRALDAALRLARAQDAALVPVFLARVSRDLTLDAPIPRQAAAALELQEAVEHHAAGAGIPIEPRIERGRTHRHALQLALAHERYDQIVIAAATGRHPGFRADDIAWLLDHAPGEIVVLRPSEPATPTSP